MHIEKIDHICFVVRDLEKTKQIYRENFDLLPALEYVAESEHIKVARYYIGEVAVEFMESTSPESDVARFIEKKGEGFFLISYKVDNLDAAMEELKEQRSKADRRETAVSFWKPLCFRTEAAGTGRGAHRTSVRRIRCERAGR